MDLQKLSVGITAFLDILGFGNRVLNSNSTDDIESIEKAIQLIRNAFNHESVDEFISEAQKISEIDVLAFSDSVIVNFPLESQATKYSGTFDPIMSDIVDIAYAQGICVQENIFIRGGVDIGWWYKDGSTLISQSLTRAYKTESTAKYPIIAVTEDLLRYFSEHKDRKYYSTNIDPIKSSFRKTFFKTEKYIT